MVEFQLVIPLATSVRVAVAFGSRRPRRSTTIKNRKPAIRIIGVPFLDRPTRIGQRVDAVLLAAEIANCELNR